MTLISRMFSYSWSRFSGGRVTPFADPQERFRAGKLGMVLFLIALGTLFGATLIGFLVIRFERATEWPRDLPPLPRLLWLSTAILIASSITLQRAGENNRAGRRLSARRLLALTLALGLGFLFLQTVSWFSWWPLVLERWEVSETQRFALTGFYVLTALHAAHVIGGVIPLALMTLNCFRGSEGGEEPGSAREYAMRGEDGDNGDPAVWGFWYATAYWHFLGGVWIILFLVMQLGM